MSDLFLLYVAGIGKLMNVSLGFILPQTSQDRMYWIPKEGRGFVLLDERTARHLVAGKAKL